jgi:4-hydroxybenzoate polyprenyltransferase
LLKALLQTFRPHQWVKNLFVLAPLVFAKELFDLTLGLRALAALAIFCLLASAVYTINDILDVDKDRLHPKKCERPIPSGLLTTRLAAAAAVGLISLSLVGAGFLGVAFATTASTYLLLNLAYSVRLKEVAFVDVACISTGRDAGPRVPSRGAVPPSFYLVACTFLLALPRARQAPPRASASPAASRSNESCSTSTTPAPSSGP